MSITHSVFFTAPAKEAAGQNLSEGIPAPYPSVPCNFIDEYKVAALEQVLTGKNAEEAMKILMARCIYQHDDSGIAVLQLVDDLVKALAALTPERSVEVAKQWLAVGSWGRFGRRTGDHQELTDIVTAIAKLATAAQSPGHGLFLWVCP